MIPTTDETPEAVKARGAFYTPSEVTSFLARWAIRTPDDRILEPSCGDGAFVDAARARFAELGCSDPAAHLFGVEIEASEAEKSRALAPGASIRTASFFDVGPGDLPVMDAAFGNPPFIRYHGWVGENRRASLRRAREQGVELTNLASSWASFVVHASAFLPPNAGRIGLVLPAELLHTDYAEPLRAFLSRRFSSVVVVAFDRLVFDDAQVDAVLLLTSNDDQAGMRVVRVHDASDLAGLDVSIGGNGPRRAPERRWSMAIDADAEVTYRALLASGRVCRLSDLGSVDIGVVTGANRFFILPDERGRVLGLPADVLSAIVEAPSRLAGLLVMPAETAQLIDLRGKAEPTNECLLAYLASGEATGVSGGYKCRKRKPWYAVPLPRVRGDAFIPYMNHRAPRMIVNAERAWSTNLLHAFVRRDDAPDIRSIAAAMLSSVTMLSAEIEGRAYGGGVLKLETKEAERLLVPALTPDEAATLAQQFGEFDRLVREGRIEVASERVDQLLEADRKRNLAAYEVFRSRRLGRKRSV